MVSLCSVVAMLLMDWCSVFGEQDAMEGTLWRRGCGTDEL